MKAEPTSKGRAKCKRANLSSLVAPSELGEPTEKRPLELAEQFRQVQIGLGNRKRRAGLGQFFTSLETAKLLASMSLRSSERLRVLDAGAGAGALTAALVTSICSRPVRPKELHLVTYEVDESVLTDLRQVLVSCERSCQAAGIRCTWEIRPVDFIESAVNSLDAGLFQTDHETFDVAILNPPYKKFRSESRVRQLLRRLGIETSNLYAAFLSVVVLLLDKEGELIAITPRSFCNGPYFRPFRAHLLLNLNFTRFHVFESRGRAFGEDEVLQENLVFRAVKSMPQQATACLSENRSPNDPIAKLRAVAFDHIVRPKDPEKFIHLAHEEGRAAAETMEKLPSTLAGLGLTVSTGKVVDFRARQWLRADPTPETVPLIYPGHLDNGSVRWPRANTKKPNAIVHNPDSASLMVPTGVYVLVRRFSAKEERRRVVAAVFDPETIPCDVVGFENHVNYFHEDGRPLNRNFARGLSLFLNCTSLDVYFRQFNGHTQVNATDLRWLRYPTRATLAEMGKRIGETLPSQEAIDEIVAGMIGPR